MFNRFNSYTVHLKPISPDPAESAIFIREGFNWWAFIFGTLWALYHRLWWIAALFLGVNMVLQTLAEQYGLNPASAAALQLGVQAIIAFTADDLLRAKLQKRGYITAAIVTGDNALQAEQRFFERYAPAG